MLPLFPIFSRLLYSTAGDAGLLDLESRAQIWLEPLSEAWRSTNEADRFSRLFDMLAAAITDLDTVDLRPSQVRLRPAGGIPVGVICKLTRALIEFLAEGDEDSERSALDGLVVARQSRNQSDFDFGFRAALAEFLIDVGAYDRAVALIDENLSRRNCPYSQHLLFRALSRLKQTGVIADSSRIGLGDVSDRFCDQPFQTIATSPPSGNSSGSRPPLFACSCPSMLPYPLMGSGAGGKMGIEDIWNGPEIQEIRRSVLEGDFTYCSRTLCAPLIKGDLPKRDDITDPVMRDIIDNKRTRIATAPRAILLAHDHSCNLACPSCRSKIRTIKNKARKEMDDFVDQFILSIMEDADVTLYVAGDGDPIGSKHYRKLLHSLDPIRHRGVKVSIHSNGLLVTPKEWESLAHIQHLVSSVAISIDAAEAATYEDVRRPGKWKILTSNMEFLANLRRTGKLPELNINFVVQKKNFEQMPAFVELGQHWSADHVIFMKLLPIFHPDNWKSDDFVANAVLDESHPDHPRFLKVLKNPILRSKEVNLYNLGFQLDAISDTDSTPNTGVTFGDGVKASNGDHPPPKKPRFWSLLFQSLGESAEWKSLRWFDRRRRGIPPA